MRRILLLIIGLGMLSISSLAQIGNGAIKGAILEAPDFKTPVPYANVSLWQGGNLVTGAVTDLEGVFELKAINPGEYTIKLSSMGFADKKLKGIRVKPNKTVYISEHDAAMVSEANILIGVDIDAELEVTREIIDMDGVTTDGYDEKEFMAVPGRNLAAKLKGLPGIIGNENGSGDIFVKGQKPDAGYYLVNGVKMKSISGIPMTSVSGLEAYTSGLPASIGDATGAVISITTKSATEEFHGGIEHVTSGFKLGDRYYGADAFGYNLTEFSLSGPLMVKTINDSTKETQLGFFVAGNYSHQLDPRPSAVGAWKIKDEALADLQLNPLRTGFSENSVIPNSDYLRLDDFERVDVRPNTSRTAINLTGNIDVNTTKNTTLTFGGAVNSRSGNRYDYDHSLLDFNNYPMESTLDWQLYGRFTQRFQNVDEKGVPKGLIANASYTIQADYSRSQFKRENEAFKDDFFKYGYLGRFTTYQTVDFAIAQDSTTGIYGNIQQTFRDTLITFEPGDANPELARFTQRYYELNGWEGFNGEGQAMFDPDRIDALANYNNIQSGGGLINGDNLDSRSRSVYGMWVYNNDLVNAQGGMTDNYSERLSEQLRLTGQGTADIGNHSIVLGFEYEQRVERGYSLNPRALWTIARQRSNTHLEQLDFQNGNISYPGPTIVYDRLNAAPGPYDASDEQSFIDYNMRKVVGLDADGTDFLDINSIDPDLYRIEYFAADELYNSGNSLVSYYGYDPYSNRTSERSQFDDFFSAKDEFGNPTRPIDAFRPVYVAGYIEDQFEFRHINFRIGLRVDQYDANQNILKDKYVLFPTVKAGEEEAKDLLAEERSDHPGNIGDDYVVYVDNVQAPTEIVGYRNGDVWYNTEGAELSDAGALRVSNGLPAPLLVNKNATSSTNVTSESFEDYTPTPSFMPRIAFNFPIARESKFYAHYDILTKRPTVGNRLDPSDYYYLESRASSAQLNNPDLKPERTTSYEVGFEQKVTYNSAISIAAFYTESRDMVQATRVFDAYPIEYQTFENLDFSTVKGMTVSYDYRRVKHLAFRASYTLQFAEGTGSSATSQLNLARSGAANLRAPIRLSYDQRHQITANVDYRFGDQKVEGAKYVMENVWVRNSGVNLQVRGGSGMPFNPQTNFTSSALFSNTPSPLQSGTINSANLPWKFRFDLGVDRMFFLERADTNKDDYALTASIQVLNLLNARTLNNVYRATGNPDDDGYLNSAGGQVFAENQNSEAAFQEYYAMKLMDPNNWELPRRIQVGIRMNF
jgi:hypothetical protein